MNARFVLIAAALASSSAYAADAPKAEPARVTQLQQEPAKLLLASADKLRVNSSDKAAASAPAKRPNARVTTCRCGGQIEEQADDE